VLADFCWHDERAATITKPCDDRLCCSMSREWVTLYSVAGAGAHCGRGAVVYVHWYQTLRAHFRHWPLDIRRPLTVYIYCTLWARCHNIQAPVTSPGYLNFNILSLGSCSEVAATLPCEILMSVPVFFTTVFWASGGSLRLMTEHDNYFKQKIYHKVVQQHTQGVVRSLLQVFL